MLSLTIWDICWPQPRYVEGRGHYFMDHKRVKRSLWVASMCFVYDCVNYIHRNLYLFNQKQSYQPKKLSVNNRSTRSTILWAGWSGWLRTHCIMLLLFCLVSKKEAISIVQTDFDTTLFSYLLQPCLINLESHPSKSVSSEMVRV